jgi:hypothetical protein
MSHMAAVPSRQFDQSSFDERAYFGDLPQNRLAPRHEPVFGSFYVVHIWTVLIRANNCNKKSACDDISFVAGAFQPHPSHLFAVYSASFNIAKVRQFSFSAELNEPRNGEQILA